jgi:hypothetical protein
MDGISTLYTVDDELRHMSGVFATVTYATGGLYPGAEVYESLDGPGLLLYGSYVPNLLIPGLGAVNSRVTFHPPILVLSDEVAIGDDLDSSGTAYFTYEGLGSYPLDFAANSSVLGLESVTAPSANSKP